MNLILLIVVIKINSDNKILYKLKLYKVTSIKHLRVVRELTDLTSMRGKPGMIVSDNGTELTSNIVLEWFGTAKIDWHYTAPGKPTQIRLLRVLTDGCVTNCSMRHYLPA